MRSALFNSCVEVALRRFPSCAVFVLQAGDAILCCWPTLGEGLTLEEMAVRAIQCGLQIQQKYDNFDIGLRDFRLRCKVTASVKLTAVLIIITSLIHF